MPGLSLGTSLHARVSGSSAGAPTSGGLVAPDATSVASAAFGPGYSSAAPSTASLLHPGKPVGLATFVGAGAIGLLILLRQSLPR